MKKVILVAFVLAICGVLHNSALAQFDNRYRVTYAQSLRTGGQIQSATVVTVVNQSSQSCNIAIDWFQSGGAHECGRRSLPLDPGDAVHFCSRALPNNITNCGGSQTTCGQQDFNVFQGTAIVSSSTGPACSNIAVDARVYYTTAGDTAISGISNSKIVFIREGNLGD